MLAMFLFTINIANAQINKDLKIKISSGIYGLTSLTEQYDAYRFDLSLNYSLGLVKDFKLNANGNWVLRSELLYNRTIVKNGEDELKDKYKKWITYSFLLRWFISRINILVL